MSEWRKFSCDFCVNASSVYNMFDVQVFKSNKTVTGVSRYLGDAILHTVDGLQKLLIYDRSLQPVSK